MQQRSEAAVAQADEIRGLIGDTAHSGEHAAVQCSDALSAVLQASELRSAVGSEDVRAVARIGTSDASQPLPHLGRIQAAFGKHDVSNVSAHMGASAAKANEALGSKAYATGKSVAFGSSPDVFTAAHEAAHVVQQRGGVQLAGGVGKSGDRYEKHADKVAEAVVAGRSAEPLLDSVADSSGTPGVQRTEDVQFFHKPAHKEMTRKAVEELPKIGRRVTNLIVADANEPDYRASRILGAGVQIKLQLAQTQKFMEIFKMVMNGKPVSQEDLDKLKDTINSFVTMRGEGPEHGEGSDYTEPRAASAAKNKTFLINRVTVAASRFKEHEPDWTLYLAQALHAAQDRGSHDEGGEWEGHFTLEVGKIDKYMGGTYDTDSTSDNSEGEAHASKCSAEVIQLFLSMVGPKAQFSDFAQLLRRDRDMLERKGVDIEQYLGEESEVEVTEETIAKFMAEEQDSKVEEAEAEAEKGFVEHTTVKGDTLANLGRRFDVPWQKIAKATMGTSKPRKINRWLAKNGGKRLPSGYWAFTPGMKVKIPYS